MTAVLAWVAFTGPNCYAQGTAFSYQGQLMNNGQAASGNYDITFTLFAYSQYGFPVGPVLTNIDTPVSGGLFSTTLDFGTVFNGSTYWLEIAVRTNGNGYFTTLEPRQLLTPVPYAVFSANASNALAALTATTAASAASVPAGGIVGSIPLANLPTNVALLTANGTLPTSTLPTNVALLTANGTLPASVLPTNLASASGIVWQSPSATTVQAQPNVGYVLTNSQQVTITLPATPNIGDIVEIAGSSLGGWILAQNPGQTIAASFTPMSLSGDASGNWYAIASSSDGSRLAAVSQDQNVGGIWTSSNSGTNWRQTSAFGGYWYSIASSSDGTKLAAANPSPVTNGTEFAGGIFVSSDSGTNWTLAPAPPYIGWQCITLSSDGKTLAAGAVTYSGGPPAGIWTSTNFGTNWIKTSAPTNLSWTSIASSSDATKLVAASLSGGEIWVSSNSGSNWAEATDLPLAGWQSVASSSNGMTLVAAASYVYIGDNGYPGGIWISTNTGATWAQTSAPVASWTSVASSSDGTKLAAVVNADGASGGGIWTSSNAGANWVQVGLPSPDWFSTFSQSSWSCVAASSDGTKLAAGYGANYGDGGIWTILNGVVSHQNEAVSGATMLGTAGFLEGNFGTVVELIYAGQGQFIALYQTGSFSGH
ncbi:MAG TPA: hypothetical protein VGO67_14520 [Verrucomicrobiae bacterium]|jgi:hypothetical protein